MILPILPHVYRWDSFLNIFIFQSFQAVYHIDLSYNIIFCPLVSLDRHQSTTVLYAPPCYPARALTSDCPVLQVMVLDLPQLHILQKISVSTPSWKWCKCTSVWLRDFVWNLTSLNLGKAAPKCPHPGLLCGWYEGKMWANADGSHVFVLYLT